MDENLKQFGFGAIFLTMIARELFSFLKTRKESNSDESGIEKYRQAANENRLEQAITSLKENMIKQTSILERMREDHSTLLNTVARIKCQNDD